MKKEDLVLESMRLRAHYEEKQLELLKIIHELTEELNKARKEAHWIKHEWAEESEGLLIPNYECSQCHTWKRENSDYCPECGCKMTEVI